MEIRLFTLLKKVEKISTNKAILDEMVDGFVDIISETFSRRKYCTLISESRTVNIHFTIKKRKF